MDTPSVSDTAFLSCWKKDAIGLLKEMAARNVLVEINLTSNDQILGVSGGDHPLHALHEIWCAYRRFPVMMRASPAPT